MTAITAPHMKPYYVAIPAYNEANNIGACLKAVGRASVNCRADYELRETLVCVNGCTDQTETVVKHLKDVYPHLNIRILHSDKGMNKALNKIMDNISSRSAYIIKIDADAEPSVGSFRILLDQFSKLPKLKVVGGYPEARYYKGGNIYKRFLSNVFDIRSRYPQSQVSVLNVEEFHPYAYADPQERVSSEFETRSRIYFHGRFYALRNKNIWSVPEDRIGDDTYLTLDVYKKFWPGAIRLMYDAICYYQPTVSLQNHWKVYKRIFCDTKTLFKLREFQSIQDIIGKEAVKLNWRYINKLKLSIRILFVIYSLFKKVESVLFKLTPDKNVKELWSYSSKERVAYAR